jgi:serine/threonine protein kinase
MSHLQVHELIRSNPCPSLVEILDVSSSDGVLMEYCNEGDLQALLAKSRRRYMPLREVTSHFLEIMKGLAHLHKLKIVHADVSPQNIFLRQTANGSMQCVLGDFGHSYVLEMHAESRSSVADHCGQGAEFVAPGMLCNVGGILPTSMQNLLLAVWHRGTMLFSWNFCIQLGHCFRLPHFFFHVSDNAARTRITLTLHTWFLLLDHTNLPENSPDRQQI